MELASIIHQYYNAFIAKYADSALPGHLNEQYYVSIQTLKQGDIRYSSD